MTCYPFAIVYGYVMKQWFAMYVFLYPYKHILLQSKL